MGGWSYGSELGRAIFLASLTIALFAFALIEFLCFFILKIDIFDFGYKSIILLAIEGLIVNRIFDYIYLTRKRYDHINSSASKPFTMNINIGVALCFLLLILSMLSVIAAGVIDSKLLTK